MGLYKWMEDGSESGGEDVIIEVQEGKKMQHSWLWRWRKLLWVK